MLAVAPAISRFQEMQGTTNQVEREPLDRDLGFRRTEAAQLYGSRLDALTLADMTGPGFEMLAPKAAQTAGQPELSTTRQPNLDSVSPYALPQALESYVLPALPREVASNNLTGLNVRNKLTENAAEINLAEESFSLTA